MFAIFDVGFWSLVDDVVDFCMPATI